MLCIYNDIQRVLGIYNDIQRVLYIYNDIQRVLCIYNDIQRVLCIYNDIQRVLCIYNDIQRVLCIYNDIQLLSDFNFSDDVDLLVELINLLRRQLPSVASAAIGRLSNLKKTQVQSLSDVLPPLQNLPSMES